MLRNNDDGSEKGSLLWLMDHTKTPFGGRLLRNWVAHPLTDRQRINERLDAVEDMVAAGSATEQGGKVHVTSTAGDTICIHYISSTCPVQHLGLHKHPVPSQNRDCQGWLSLFNA